MKYKFLVDPDDFELIELQHKMPIRIFKNNTGGLDFYVETEPENILSFLYKNPEFRLFYNTDQNMFMLTASYD